MLPRRWLPAAAAIIISVLVAGCGPRLQTQPPRVAPDPAPVARQAPPPPADPAQAEDPVARLIATSTRHFTAGERELGLGHLEQAKLEFNRAIAVLLESPLGARTDRRVREHFDRLVDRISTYEITALAEGDGFTEKKYEAASIDELLAISTFEQPAASPAVTAAVANDLKTTTHDIPIPLNAKVLSYVELFQGKLRDWIEAGLSRGSRYLPMIQNVFRAEGLPLDLAYVPLIESAFKPNAVSRAKAKGVWQFMRGTALENGLKQDWYIDERSDPEKSTVAAAKYLRTLAQIFKGDWHLALASYNGGPGRIQKALGRSKVLDFWGLAAKPKLLPRETREYVPMILAAIVIARNPGQYGFTIDAEPSLAFERVTLTRPVDLRRVAEWTGASITDIQALNPELRRWTTPVDRTRYPGYELKVPEGTAGALEARLREAAPGETTALRWYTVKAGDTLSAIAQKLRVGRTELAEANYLSARARVSTGQQLIVPREPATILAARTARTDPPVTASRPAASRPSLVAQAPTGPESERVKVVYQVKRGDTLSSIARLFKTTVESLRVWNRLPGSRINPGDRLTVFTRRAP
jgi:membrane-bound lytic murein transglycosylase D